MAKKLVAFLLAVTTFVAVAGPASAVTIDELLAQIAALQAQLIALQGGQQGTSAVCLTKNLQFGMTDNEIKVLQGWLNVSPQSGYFGPLTKAAVIAYQKANSISPTLGYFGPLTRASANAKFCSGTPGTTPAPAGSVSVALSPLTPAAGTMVADTTSADGAQALVPVATIRFTAPAAGAVSVSKVVVTRTGIAADADISNMYLFVDGVKVADSPSVSSAKSTFVNSLGLFTVPAGSYKDVVIKIDVANGTTSGKTFQFGVAAAADITSNATAVAGTFPMTGNVFTIATVSDLGKMTIQTAIPSSNASVDAGTLGFEAFRFSAVSSDQPQQVSYVKLTAVGTADYDALQNLKLYADGTQVGSTVAMMSSDKTVAFDLSAAPLSFTSGQTRTISLRVDVVKGANRNFYFEVANGADFVSKDTTYGMYVKTNQSNVFTLFKAAGTTTISAGSITVTKATTSPTGPLTANVTNVKVAEYDVKAVGEDIRVSQMNFKSVETSAHTLKNVYVTIDGSQYGTKVATLADSTSQAYTGNYTFPAGLTKKVAVYADLISPIVSGDSFTVTFVQGASNGVRQSSGTSLNVPGADQGANAIAVSAGGVTMVKNGSVANVSTVVSASNVLLGSWLLSAPSDQGVRINAITVNNGTGQTEGLGAAFNNLTLWIGGTQYGQTISSPSTTADTAQTFTFSTPLTVNAGQTVQVDIRANVLSGASTTAWNGTATADTVMIVTSTGVDATGVSTNSAVTYSSGNIVGQTITLNAGATLTIATESSPTMPDSTYLVAGDTGMTLAAFRFTANNTEDVVVTRVVVNETGTPDVPGNFKNIKLFVGGVQVGATAPAFVDAASNTVTFSDSNGLFTVPKNDYKQLIVKADMTDKTNATFADAGKEMKASLYVANGTATQTTNVSAKGSTSGTYVTLAGGATPGTYLNGNAMTFVRSRPVFAYVAPSSTTLVPGTMEVLRFRITAHSDDDVKFLGTTASSNIRLTVLAGKAGATGTMTLYDASNNTVLATLSGTSLATAATANFAFDGANLTVAAGTTKELYVTADLSAFSTLGNSFQVKIGNAAADMSFNDSSSVSADISAANYAGIGLSFNGATFVKP